MSTSPTPFDFLETYGVVPVVTISDAADALFLAEALLEGGLPLIEITFRSEAAAEAIAQICQKFPEMTVGAGTLLTDKNLADAMQAGAQFGVAPGTNPVMVELCDECKFPFIPGVCTPSEVETAIFMGSRVLKFFPATLAGGAKMLQAVYAPYASTGVRFMPTGGITQENLTEYLKLPAVLACGGTWLATKEEISEKKWSFITEKCRRAVEIAAAVNK